MAQGKLESSGLLCALSLVPFALCYMLFAAFNPNIPLFQHSIIPCGRHKLIGVKKNIDFPSRPDKIFYIF
jgi:hypothetical protein